MQHPSIVLLEKKVSNITQNLRYKLKKSQNISDVMITT